MYTPFFYFSFPFNLTGVVGFEPTNTGVKFLCLTTWRYPNNQHKALTSRSCTVHMQLFKIWSLISNLIYASILFSTYFQSSEQRPVDKVLYLLSDRPPSSHSLMVLINAEKYEHLLWLILTVL